ncbi:SCO6745 family protein [Streptomyces sp. 7N604]|uniref:SCO6745 family protein n=1 Tax=Streptomyces sp. 7N604 TaxID=3457415 RepID=UPI003FD13F57
MTTLSLAAVRRCHDVLNALHSTVYFTPHLDKELVAYGIDDPMAVYLAGRAAALGPVGAGTVTAAFYSFRHDLVARHIPGVWRAATPETVWAARLRAVDLTLRDALGGDVVAGPLVTEAAELALRATEGCRREGRPLYSAHADQPVPDEPHLALWFAATLLREHRGDGHVTALSEAGLDGLEALVSHTASGDGMPKDVVMTKRGWSERDWSAAQQRLRRQGLMAADGALTPAGHRMRHELEVTTDRLDRDPYDALGAQRVERLTQLVGQLVDQAAATGVFPAPLLPFFTGGAQTARGEAP